MRGAFAAIAALAIACSPPAKPQPPGGGGTGSSGQGAAPADAADDEAKQEERLAAIQKAMNELDEAVQGCWAAVAAADRFDIEGDLVAMIEVAGRTETTNKVTIVSDSTKTPKLGACVTELLAKYVFAPPLYGQGVQLPFQFRAPKGGQNVVDRRLVPWKQQDKVAVAVLLDEANSGNASASLLDVKIEAGGSTGMRQTERAELWFFHDDATIKGPSTGSGGMGAGKPLVSLGLDFAYVPAGGARDVIAPADQPLTATVLVLPGGREGAARAGALPTKAVTAVRSALAGPTLVQTIKAKTYTRGKGKVAIVVEPATIKARTCSASLLDIPAGMTIPEHVHEQETELLYIETGAGTMTVNGVAIAVTEHSVVQVPPNTKHAFTATSAITAVQFYTPAGPEQRFKQ